MDDVTHARKGFTLVELIVTVILVGILTATAAPMISNMKAKAIATEAVLRLSTMRQAIRNNSLWSGVEKNMMYKEVQDLDGNYFSSSCYTSDFIIIWCTFADNSAPKHDEVTKLTDDGTDDGFIAMDMNNGKITQSNFSRSGYPPSP